jgi:quercetin dioxygenase-like cupin family protein
MSKQNPVLVILATAALVACSSDAPLASAEVMLAQRHAPPGATVVHRAEMRVDELPAEPFVLIHALLDFQPGTWFPAHEHGGPTLYTVVDGSVEVHDAGSITEYQAGQSYQHEAGRILAAGNLGDQPSAMAVAFVLMEGEELITFDHIGQAGAELPAPEISHLLTTRPLVRTAPFTVVQLVIALEPGTSTPLHSQPGPSLFTVLDGEVTLRTPGAGVQLVTTRDGWGLDVGQPAVVGNPGESTARFVGTYLVPVANALGRLHK